MRFIEHLIKNMTSLKGWEPFLNEYEYYLLNGKTIVVTEKSSRNLCHN